MKKCFISAKVLTGFGGKQPLLLPIPVGFERMVSRVVVRNPTVSLALFDGEADTEMGFNSLASNWWSDGGNLRFKTLTTPETAIIRTAGGETEHVTIGHAGQIFGVQFNFTSIDAELWIDIEHYDYKAE